MYVFKYMFSCCVQKNKLGPRNPPCFGVHREGLFRWLAIVNFFITVVGWYLLLLDILPYWNSPNDRSHRCGNESFYIRIIGWCTISVHLIVTFVLDIILYTKSKSPHTFHLSTYIYYTWISLPVLLLYVVWWTYCGLVSISFEAKCLFPAYLCYKCVICFVIQRYIRDIQFARNLFDGYRDLNEEEIFEFIEGRKNCDNIPSEMFLEERVLYDRYKDEEYEIPMENLDFENSTLLGTGEYGCVYKVILSRRNTNGTTCDYNVAVKSTDPKLNDVHCFLAILKEAKTLLYLGEHRNIVKLIGLCTQEICSTSKKVIHGDLATRNVLVTENRTVKITDFGLSRRLYNYSIYIKQQKSPLPWRWLAIEALVDMNFSTSSDVWSYGITCWEIFELGKHPWSQYPQYSMEFIQDLKNGIRLDRPGFCDEQLFKAIIMPCWNSDPSLRPNFNNILSYLKPFAVVTNNNH
ncbi:unnamed protein product [Orchesella dallaii]|uniref:Protein kinase domain-containing protein n=1 Tax=Orchesella dallaii TaxID=48710 RepID=A0ABP1QH08_9HEXA